MSAIRANQVNDVKLHGPKKRKREEKSDVKGKAQSIPRKSRKKNTDHEAEVPTVEANLRHTNDSDEPRDGTVSPILDSEKSSRFIVFVGNLPYSCSTDAIEKHFTKVKPTKVRHITDKDKGTSKGYAFLEFEGYDRMKTCLNSYHGTKIKGRKIRVELTAGGGGAKSQIRRDKIAAKNLRLNGQRFRREQEELGQRTKDCDGKENTKDIDLKAQKMRSKAKYNKKAIKERLEKATGQMADTDHGQPPDTNADVHPSRRKLLTR